MAAVIRFSTDLFDVSRERPNPINPIPGESLLLWLRERIGESHAMTTPDAEDWGWYSVMEWESREYLIGACAEEGEDGRYEWILQVDKIRSFSEKLLGREKMATDDPCATYLNGLLAAEPTFHDLALD